MKKKVFYGWVITAGCCIVMASSLGIASNCMSLFIKPLCEELEQSRKAVGGIASVYSIGSMLVSFFAGRVFTKQNILKVMRAALLVMIGMLTINSFAKSLWVLYLTGFVCGACTTLSSVLPTTFVLNNWFTDNVGVALGLASMGSGLGGAIFNPLCGGWITTYGWRTAYLFMAGAMALLTLPTVFFVLKLTPEEMGLTPYRKAGAKTPKAAAAAAEETGMSFAEAKRSTLFWVICACGAVIGAAQNMLYQTISPRLTDLSCTLEFSAKVISVGMICLAIGKLLLGKMFDAFGARTSILIACGSLLAGHIGLLVCGSTLAGLALVMLGMAFGESFGAVCFPLAVPRIFGKKDYRAIMGPISAMISMGGAVGPFLSGWAYDSFGSYNGSYIVCAVVMAAVAATFVVAIKDEKTA